MTYELFASESIEEITKQLNEFIKRNDIEDHEISNEGMSFNDGMHMFFVRYDED